MDENQTNQNLNQQPVQWQPVQSQPEQVQQPVQWQPEPQQPATDQQQVQSQPAQWQSQPEQQPSVSMQIQQLLVQQQQYQKQYNDLVDYVKKTPNLPIEQVNQIKAQLDQLNALFVEWKQKLQALWYNQVQVQKPVEVKKWSVTNFSLKKVAIWCAIVLLLIFAGFFLTLSSLIKNPNALDWIGVWAATAKVLLQAFTGLLFWSVILIMMGVIISNIYRLITVKNQSKWKFIRWLIWWIIWATAMWALIWLVFSWIWKIVTEVKQIDYDIIQPYLVWRVKIEWEDEFKHPYRSKDMVGKGENYPLIAPSEMAFSIRWDELLKRTDRELPLWYQILDVKLLCGNKDETVLELNPADKESINRRFVWTCIYSQKWTYTYGIELTYDNTTSTEKKTVKYSLNSLNFESEVRIYKTITSSNSANSKEVDLTSSNGEFLLWKAPAKITIDANEVFRDFSTKWYEVEWDMDGDFESDRVNQAAFDYSYRMPQVYYITYKFSEIYDDLWYRFPVRVEQSDKPVCWVDAERYPWTNKYQIVSNFVDESSVATISSYNYTIKNSATRKVLKELRDQSQKITYEFPDTWSFVVVLDYVTVDGKQWWCESDLIQLEKETFNVQYSLLAKNPDTWRFKEICNDKSKTSEYNRCTEIKLDAVPQSYQLQIKTITPMTINTSKAVYFENTEESVENTHALMEDNETYDFTIPDEWNYELRIVTSDKTIGIDDATKVIKFVAKKPDIIWILSITTAETDPNQRKPISEGFEPLQVILDASKTEINVPWDEIIYFTWDFGDGEVKTNQQNWVVGHTYNYDYKRETWIFEPKVTITTLQWLTEVVSWPKLNVKKWLISIEVSSISHPSRQAPANANVTFIAEFDWLPERMTWDFGDGSPTYTCKWRSCTEVTHAFENTWIYSVKVSLDFDAIQQVDEMMDIKIY